MTADLTRTEQEILALVAQGLSNREIGALRHVELETVKYHVSNILRKLEVSNRTAAAAAFLEGRAA